jgi:hypothetical protein
MTAQKQRRRRGVVLTTIGDRKLQAARMSSERATNFGVRYTNEELSAITGLSMMTLARIFTAKRDSEIGVRIPVDKRTLDRCFQGFDLTLERSDYLYCDNTADLPVIG